MYISGQNNIYGNPVNGKFFDVKKLKKTEKEEKELYTEEAAQKDPDQREDSLEISPEGRLAAAQEQDDPETSEEQSGKVAVNEGKRMRQIAAAKSRGQLQQVLALLQKDLSDCKAGLEKGWCDESEIAKVEALINRAKDRMSQVPQNDGPENEEAGLDEFAMASLM